MKKKILKLLPVVLPAAAVLVALAMLVKLAFSYGELSCYVDIYSIQQQAERSAQ